MRSNDPYEKLARAGIRAPWQVLMWMPRRHIDYTQVVRSGMWSAYLDEKVCADFIVQSKPKQDPYKPRFTLSVYDQDGEHKLTGFGRLRFSAWRNIDVGDYIRVYGKVSVFNGRAYINSPVLVPKEHWGRVIPVYRGVPGVVSSDSVFRAAQAAMDDDSALDAAVSHIRHAFDWASEETIMDSVCKICGIIDIFHAVHRPTSLDHAHWGMTAAKRLVVNNIRHLAAKAGCRPFNEDSIIHVPREIVDRLVESLPFKPTTGKHSQASAIDDILRMLKAPYPMNAVLSADVGVGKTLVYALVAAAAQTQGIRVGIMIPNSLLVEQVAKEFAHLFPATPTVTVMEGISRRKSLDLSNNPVLIGTSALVSFTQKNGWVPDLLVVDEQQKLSVQQRRALCAEHTNYLECTATALPRTLALITHGGQDLIQVKKRHATPSIVTSIVDAQHRKKMLQKIDEELASGGSVAVIYPLVEDSGLGDKKSVEAAAALWEARYPGLVAILHGKMSAQAKSDAMAEVKAGNKRILVASSIIEIGVTISDLRLLVIVHADRYGCSTLHQMRGRLARHGGQGWCYLYLPEPVDEETIKRLKLLEATTDGFKLAELDMNLRGFGDLSLDSQAQSGASLTLFRDLRLMPQDID